MKLPVVVVLAALSGCSAVLSTNGCPGDVIGELDCSGKVCKMSYEREVYYLIVGEPANAQELLGLVEIGSLYRKRWFASNTGKFKLFVGGPSKGYAYQYTKGANGWVATLEPDAYACTG